MHRDLPNESGVRHSRLPPPTSGGPVLSVSRLEVRYGKIPALGPIDFTVVAGELLLVLGPNGAGKTTLLRALAGAVAAYTGTISLGGRNVTDVPAFRRARAGIALVPERRGVLPGLSVKENLQLGVKLGQRSGRTGWTLTDVLELFPPLGERLKQDCASLSGGEMQMLALGRAILSCPEVLLVDEASLGLAPRIIGTVYRAIESLNRRGMTAIIVEQKAIPLATDPTQTVVLQRGSVVRHVRDTRISERDLASLYLAGQVE